jgi:hypothetical protein
VHANVAHVDVGMAVDTAWAIISMGAVISMRGHLSAGVAIAVFNQLEEVNQLVGCVQEQNSTVEQYRTP